MLEPQTLMQPKALKCYYVEQPLLMYAQSTNITDDWPLAGANFEPIITTLDLLRRYVEDLVRPAG